MLIFSKEYMKFPIFKTLTSGAAQSASDSVAAWRRIGYVILSIFVVFCWIAAAAALTFSSLAIFIRSAMNAGQALDLTDKIILLIPLAVFFVGATALARNFVPTLKELWIKLEDMIGRVIVYFHSLAHTCGGRSGIVLRKILGCISITIALLGELACLTWAFSLLREFSLSENPSFIELFGNDNTFIFSLSVTISVVIAVLLIRYSVSAKWQAIYAKPQFTDSSFVRSGGLEANVRLLHASDFHVTGNDTKKLTEGEGQFPDATLKSIMDAIEQDAKDCDVVLITGDITDTGSVDEWERFLTNCSEHIRRKLILVPGNHDLNLQDGLLASKAERVDSAGRKARQIRMIAAMSETMQDRAFILDTVLDRLFSLDQYIQRHENTFTAGAPDLNKPVLRVDELWQTLFPMVVLVEPDRNGKRLGVVLLDSVKPGSLGLTNAIGTVSPDVIDRCSVLMNKMADRCDCFAIALHHHVAMPQGGNLRERGQNSGLVLENASLLIDMLTKRGYPTVIFHGHRHQAYTGTAIGTAIAIVASPSASIGKDCVAGEGSWRVVGLNCNDAGCHVVEAPQIRSLIDRGASGP